MSREDLGWDLSQKLKRTHVSWKATNSSFLRVLRQALWVRSREDSREELCLKECFQQRSAYPLPNKRTQDSLTQTRAKNYIAVAVTLTRRRILAAAFVDVLKTFDNVWHKGLQYWMTTLYLPSHVVSWTRDFLENGEVQFNVKGELFQLTIWFLQGYQM